MKALDVVILFVYLAGIVWFGSSFYRKNRTSVDFTLGSNKLPAWSFRYQYLQRMLAVSVISLSRDSLLNKLNAFAFSVSLPWHLDVGKILRTAIRSVGSPSA